jgi:hypothetical protein
MRHQEHYVVASHGDGSRAGRGVGEQPAPVGSEVQPNIIDAKELPKSAATISMRTTSGTPADNLISVSVERASVGPRLHCEAENQSEHDCSQNCFHHQLIPPARVRPRIDPQKM